MKRDSFVFYRNMWEQLLGFEDKEEVLRFLTAVCNYGFYDKEPEFNNAAQRVVWVGIKDRLDFVIERYDKKSKRKKEAKKEKTLTSTSTLTDTLTSTSTLTDTLTDTSTLTDTLTDNFNKNENYISKEKKEKEEIFRKEVFSVAGYTKNHLQSFFEYYSQPLQEKPDTMLFESFRSWNLKMQLAKWKPPKEEMGSKSTMTLKTVEEIKADRKAEQDTERQRILEMVEAYRKNPDNPSSMIVKAMEKNGTLKRHGIIL